ncbi:MAG: hypothetical protein ABIP75_04825, partial [Pyrinomonadaceae bacterium]
MSVLDPIAGISLERFAELCVKMKDCGGDLDVCANIAADNGVDRPTWEAAMSGWNARMTDPGNAGQVALAYMPLYQAALATYGGPPATATLDEYIEMSALINTDTIEPNKRPTDFDAMYARFNIDVSKWSQISTFWVDKLTKDPPLGADYGNKVCARVKELDDEFRRQQSS